MSECIICLEPCSDHTYCCKAPIHAACIGSVLEKGFARCPHCQKEMYPQMEPQIQYMTVPLVTHHPIEDKSTLTFCKNITHVIGTCVLFIAAVGLFTHHY